MKKTPPKIALTHKDKLLFPKSGITKEHLFSYYDQISHYLLPFLKDRPLTLQRFPKGIGAKGFFQKNTPTYFPDWITTAKVKKIGGWVNHVICNTKKSLLYLVNQEVLSFHIALSKIDRIAYPDKLVFDLDPPQQNFRLAVKAGKALRSLLEEELALKVFVMTSGAQGLHLVIPLKQKENFTIVHDFAKMVATYIARKNEAEFTTALRKEKRKGRLYIDYLRNSYAQTSIAPFSVRALENAPVATLLNWNELENSSLNAQSFTITTIFERLKRVHNPWEGLSSSASTISGAKATLAQLMLSLNLK